VTLVRRMRRFRDGQGREYDELPNGLLRRRLAPRDPSPHPASELTSVIEARVGRLTEVDTTEPRLGGRA
jgi:hypothetical protein